jgi:glycosyltransferase involved in cell wall biosynthesis
MYSTSLSNPLVSVITPNFNGERFIQRVVNCVSQQNYSVEHIIVDDCSTDGSWNLLESLATKFHWLKPIRLNKNSGPVVARNEAIKIASGKYLAFLDIDDFWLPKKLSTQISFMENNNCGISFTDYRCISEDGNLIGPRIQGFSSIGDHLHHMTRYLGCLTIVIDREKYPNFSIPNISPAFRAEDFLAWRDYMRQVGEPALRCPHDLARYSVVSNSRSSKSIRAAKSVWLLYRHVERLSFLRAFFYFLCYLAFSFSKRKIYKPRFKREKVDAGDIAWSIVK